MNKLFGSLGFRLTAASFVVVFVFIFVAGVIVFKISQDAVITGLTAMVKTMSIEIPRDRDYEAIGRVLSDEKLRQTRSVWLMDGDGYLVHHPDSRYRADYLESRKNFGNVMVTLKFASPRASGTGTSQEKLSDILRKYDEGFGEYKQYGETRLLAFRVIRERNWMVGVDAPAATANSELDRIKTYIRYTGLISAVFILAFTWLAIKIIVRPYYREMEELNIRLQEANRQLTGANRALEVSNRKITTLYTISITMQETMSLEDILDLIVGGAQEVLGVDRINIMLPDRAALFQECRAAVGAGDRQLGEIRVPLTTKGGALAASYKRAQIVRVNPGEHIPPHLRLSPPLSADPFLRSSAFVVLPMVVKNRSVGVIALDNKFSRAPITDDMVNLIQIFANQAAVAVENARLYEDLRRNLEELDRRVDQLSIVNQISNTMQRMVKRREMLGFILRGIKESMGFDQLAIFMLDQVEDLVRADIGVGVIEEKLEALRVPMGEEDYILSQTVMRGVPGNYVTAKDLGLVEGLSLPLAESGLRDASGVPDKEAALAVALVPLRVIDEVVGVLAVGRVKRNTAISKKEVELLMHFANTASLAVERASLYERLQGGTESLEITDHVSKLFTFKYGQQRTNEELIKARESARPLSVLLVGIDALQEYNERCGHEQGDRAFGAIGHMVRMVMFGNDLAFRYGGRLICCLLPGRTASEGRVAADKLRRLISEHRFLGPQGTEDQKLTASIGLFEYHGQEGIESPSDLFRTAMVLLHQAEAAGGDRIIAG